MNTSEWLSIMHHDVKMWELAEKEEVRGGLQLTMRDMPWGIGDAVVTLEGITNAIERQNAVGSYGAYIRGLIDEEINDEAVEARAKQASAFAREDADTAALGLGRDRDSAGVGGTPSPVQGVVGEDAVPTFMQAATVSADPTTRLAELRAAVGEAQAYITSTSREIKALEAYVAVMETQKAPEPEAEEPLTGADEPLPRNF